MTEIDIGSIHILEPMTVATDLLLAFFCYYFYWKLKHPTNSEPLLKYWRLFFLIFGLSTLIGALAHGLRSYMTDPVFSAVWMAMNLTSVLSSYFLLLATIEMIRVEWQRKLRIIAIIITLIITAITVIMNDFLMIKIYAGIILLITIILNIILYRKKAKGSGWIAFGFAFSLLAILVHTAKLSLHEYFNFKDISHIIMLISLCFIFRGVYLKTREVGSGQ